MGTKSAGSRDQPLVSRVYWPQLSPPPLKKISPMLLPKLVQLNGTAILPDPPSVLLDKLTTDPPMLVNVVLFRKNPLEPERIWEKLYTGSAMNGRRGAVICAIGALDMALWDIRGKAEGKPCWQLLGTTAKDHVVPYASLQPGRQRVA